MTRSARPTAASHAAKTSRIIGAIMERVECMFRQSREPRINSDSIIPSRHRRDDIRWERYINRPMKEIEKASRRLI